MGRERTLKNAEKAKAKAANRIKTRTDTNNIQIPTTSFDNPAFDPSSTSTMTRPSLALQNTERRQIHKCDGHIPEAIRPIKNHYSMSSMYTRKAGKSGRKSIISKQNRSSGAGKTKPKFTHSVRKPSTSSSSSSSQRRYINVPRIRI